MDDVRARYLEVLHYQEGRDEERKDTVKFLRNEASRSEKGEILRMAADLIESGAHKPGTISTTGFIAEMKMNIERSRSKSVFGYRNLDAIGPTNPGGDFDIVVGDHFNKLVILAYTTAGTHAIQVFGTEKKDPPVYELEQPHRWPKGLFEKMVSLVWVIDKPINVLDMIALKV
jgi:hypothetical protein